MSRGQKFRREHLEPYTLEQWEGVFPLGGDSLALGEFATLRSGWRVCDLGTGSGALLLLLKRRETELALAGIELDAHAAENARANLAQNEISGEIFTEDLRENSLPPGSFDLVISNPPYFSVDGGASGGRTRSEECCTLEELCTAAARLLKNGGRFALCHRPERLTDLFCALRGAGLEPKRMQLLRHNQAASPSAILVEGVRQGRPGLAILPDLLRE